MPNKLNTPKTDSDALAVGSDALLAIVDTIHASQRWLMRDEYDKDQIRASLEDQMISWDGDLEDAVKATLNEISVRHVECAHDLGRSMENEALKKLTPFANVIGHPPATEGEGGSERKEEV